MPLMHKHAPIRTLISAITLTSSFGFAATSQQEYALKASLIEKLTHFIEWPESSPPWNNTDKFNICILGKSPFGNSLNTLARATRIKDRNIKLYYQTPNKTIKHCHIAFIARMPSRQLQGILRDHTKSTLTIADTPGYASKGVMINFYPRGTQISFEINKQRLDLAGFNVSSRLLKLAKIINTNGSRR